MLYRDLGRTGVRVSALGLGSMRMPMVDGHVDYDVSRPLFRHAFELGINYVDTAFDYCNGTDEVSVGKGLKGWPREQIHVSTKIPVHTAEDVAGWREKLELQLRRLDTPYIDFHNHHDISWRAFTEQISRPGGTLEQARKAQAEGLIRHLTFSCHDTPENMVKLIDTGEFEAVTLQYNLLDRRNEPAIARARELGVGVIVMGPVGGGRLGVPSELVRRFLPPGREFKSTPEIALRFVLSNPGVTMALSGMFTAVMMEENAATASRDEPLSEAELAHVAAALDETKRLADLYCTGCGYCQPCEHGVTIAENFRLMNLHRLYGLTAYAREEYANLLAAQTAAYYCEECHTCEPKCPQHLRISEQLMEVAAALG